jgi:peptidoglycan hydrolase-like protein with peptidoglycan-binding domain
MQSQLPSLAQRQIPGRFVAVAAAFAALLTLATFLPGLAGGGTTVAEAANCPPTISRGSTGDWVAELQRSLNTKPYTESGPYLEVDGVFGPKTEAGVEKYQSYHHLTVDGIVGPQTWGSLGYCF